MKKKIQKNRNPEEILEERIEKIQRSREWKQSFWELVVIAAVLYGLFAYVIGFTWSKGDAMEPTLMEEELLLFYRLDKEYHTGDVVVLKKDGQVEYVRRIVATEGDVVDFDENTGALRINNKTVEESYVYQVSVSGEDYVEFPLTVEAGQVFVLGDNRENTVDSRTFGSVEKVDITGRVLLHVGQMYE